MKQFNPAGNFVLWSIVQIAAMIVAAWIMDVVIDLAGVEQMGRAIAPATVLLSVAAAIVIQLWLKLNDLSALASLTPEERRKLWQEVRGRVRALVELVIFFIAFIFYVLASAALASAGILMAKPLLLGVGAGFAACLVLIAGVLVDLNEVASFRWTVEASDIAAKRAKETLGELRKPDEGFGSDANIQGYKRVSGS